MKYRKLGRSDIDVSLICLGTMTWAEQNTEAEAFAQMDCALDRGVNFWDTAEMYPVPTKQQTCGATEQIIGNWFAKNGNRNKVVLATKVTGRSQRNWVRDGEETRLNRAQIRQAVERSLKKLQTDYIDLYQLHWPDRRMGLWGEGNGSYLHKDDDDEVAIHDTLAALDELVKEGKIRHVGVSNETGWGVASYLTESRLHDLPRIVSIQNSYSLVNRVFEGGLSEFSYREQVGLLAYSPLGMGALSGKYVDGKLPPNSRQALYPDFMQRYKNPLTAQAISGYVDLAAAHSMTPTELALGFVNTRPFMTSNIIGATSIEQLKENIDTVNVEISEELEAAINVVHAHCKNPAAA